MPAPFEYAVGLQERSIADHDGDKAAQILRRPDDNAAGAFDPGMSPDDFGAGAPDTEHQPRPGIVAVQQRFGDERLSETSSDSRQPPPNPGDDPADSARG